MSFDCTKTQKMRKAKVPKDQFLPCFLQLSPKNRRAGYCLQGENSPPEPSRREQHRLSEGSSQNISRIKQSEINASTATYFIYRSYLSVVQICLGTLKCDAADTKIAISNCLADRSNRFGIGVCRVRRRCPQLITSLVARATRV